MTVQRRVGAYAKLLANYSSDDAIIAAGEKAELLFVRGLAFCATSDSDGYITEAQLIRFVGAGMPDAKKRAQALVRVGVWDRVDDGYLVRSWLKIHASSEEKGYRRKTDRERKRAQSPSDDDPDSERNPNGIQTEGVAESLLCSYVSSKDLQNSSETSQGRAATPLNGAPVSDADGAPSSPFCTAHPNGTEKPCGPCGTAKLRYVRWEKSAPGRKQRAAAVAAAAREACPLCDPDGWVLAGDGAPTARRCDHMARAAG